MCGWVGEAEERRRGSGGGLVPLLLCVCVCIYGKRRGGCEVMWYPDGVMLVRVPRFGRDEARASEVRLGMPLVGNVPCSWNRLVLNPVVENYRKLLYMCYMLASPL